MCKKNFLPISIYFCVIALQIYREISKKYRKREITLEKTFFPKFEKTARIIHMSNVIPKFQSCRFNGVAIIERTPIHRQTDNHVLPNLGIPKIGDSR